jgi:tetratricopeptide (TPR) repeat protein
VITGRNPSAESSLAHRTGIESVQQERAGYKKMPFIGSNDSQGGQPLVDARTLFVARKGEQLFFVQNILKPEEPTHNIISISGQGGVGKSTLLSRLIAETRDPKFKDSCLTALVDESQTSAVGIMQKFADQLRLEGEFQKVLHRYEEAVLKLKTDQENGTLQDPLLSGVPNIAGAAVEGVPVVGPLLREGVKTTAQYFLARYYTNLASGDAESLLDPVADLTRSFVEDLNRMVNIPMVTGSRQAKRRRVILFFDTFEQLADVAVPWLLDYFLLANISRNIVLVVAGRTPLKHATSDPKRWLPYYESQIIFSMSLNCFTQDETSDYLVERGITDPDRIQSIWQLSRGLPLYLGLLTSNPRSEVDPTKDVVINFLRWIPEQEQIKRRLVLDAALFSRPFTQDDLEAFQYVSEDERSALYDWLTGLPFVRFQDGRYRYHEVAQELFRRHLYQRSKKEYYATRRAIANYYQQVLEELQQEEDKELDETSESLELLLSVTYQLLLLPDEASHIKAIEYAFRADRHIKQNGELGKMLHELFEEHPTNQATSDARRTVGLLLHYFEAGAHNQNLLVDLLVAIDDLLGEVAHESSVSRKLLATLYQRRGMIFHSREELPEAISNYNCALEYAPKSTSIYTERGNVYRWMGEFQQAIRDFDAALELNPKNSSAYAYRGLAYSQQGNYQQALEDCNRALELDPKDGWAYVSRSMIYNGLGEYQRAIEGCNTALELDPRNASRAYLQRGIAYRELEDYQHALEDFDQAIERDPYFTVNYLQRGIAYSDLKDYQRAIQDFNQAIEIAPKNAWAYGQRAYMYLQVQNTQQARADYLLSWELDNSEIFYGWMAEWSSMIDENPSPGMTQRLESLAAIDPQNYIAFVCRGVAWYLQKSFERSLAELEQAIALEPEEWDAHFWKGMVCATLRRDEDTKTSVEKSLEVDMLPVLLTPLRWFEQDRPDFYEHFVVPLLGRYV